MPISGVGQQKSFADLQTEFGGSHPITMGEYAAYRVSGSGNTIDMDDFAGAVAVDTSFQIKSGYMHNTTTLSGRRGGTLTRFSEGYNSESPGAGLSAPPVGAIDSATNIGVSSVIGTVTKASHRTTGPGGQSRIDLWITASDSNSGFTTANFNQTALGNSVNLSRTAATYTYVSGTRRWTWYYQSSDTGYSDLHYSNVSGTGFTSKIFGDANSGTGTDANFRTTITLS